MSGSRVTVNYPEVIAACRKIESDAGEMKSALNTVNNATYNVVGTEWIGPSARTFSNEFLNYTNQLMNRADDLIQAASTLRAQAQ